MCRIEISFFKAVALGYLEQPPLTGRDRAELRGQVAFTLFGYSNVGRDQSHNVLVYSTVDHQSHRRNSQPLLIDLIGSPHPPRGPAPPLTVMGSLCALEKGLGGVGVGPPPPPPPPPPPRRPKPPPATIVTSGK